MDAVHEDRCVEDAGHLAAIVDHGLDTMEEEAEFGRVAALAASLFGASASFISVTGPDGQRYVAGFGDTDRLAPACLPLCAHVVRTGQPLVIGDAQRDLRFLSRPPATGPCAVRFYAGAPLRVASGRTVGTICILSPEARSFDLADARRLESFARLVSDRIDWRRSSRVHRANEARLAQLANFDPLTGLPNRSRFHELAGPMLAGERPAAVLLFDLDGFKDVNDALGHAVGDRLLAAVGERLRAGSEGGRLLARLGGDEFALLVPDAGDPREAHRIATRLRAAFRRPFSVDGDELLLDTSVGIAMAPHHGSTVDSLLMAADLALYRAKDQGGGAVGFFEPHLRQKVEARRRMQAELRQAFEGGQFALLYQPQVDLVRGRIVGAEALLRWNHPEHGQLAPSQFLDVLDRMPLAKEVGNWALRTAIAQAARWKAAGTPIRVGVNLFAAQFRSGDLAERIAGKLARFGLPPSLIEIELTETVAIGNGHMVANALTDLREQGIGVALDDFGTGHASLSLLKELPVARLKIDQSFVRDLPHGSSDAVLVEAIVRIAESFGLDITAEGVETKDQERWLKQAGCLEAQGYLYGRPMAANLGAFGPMRSCAT